MGPGGALSARPCFLQVFQSLLFDSTFPICTIQTDKAILKSN